eukprot:768547-Pyramimonas_sp.AAC.1
MYHCLSRLSHWLPSLLLPLCSPSAAGDSGASALAREGGGAVSYTEELEEALDGTFTDASYEPTGNKKKDANSSGKLKRK